MDELTKSYKAKYTRGKFRPPSFPSLNRVDSDGSLKPIVSLLISIELLEMSIAFLLRDIAFNNVNILEELFVWPPFSNCWNCWFSFIILYFFSISVFNFDFFFEIFKFMFLFSFPIKYKPFTERFYCREVIWNGDLYVKSTNHSMIWPRLQLALKIPWESWTKELRAATYELRVTIYCTT